MFLFFLNCKSFQKFIETLQGKHFKNFLLFLEFAFNFLRFEFFLVMVCDVVVLCCFRIGKNCCSLGIKNRFPYEKSVAAGWHQERLENDPEMLRAPWRLQLSFPDLISIWEKQLDNFVASKDSKISMQKIEIFKALLKFTHGVCFCFFDSPSTWTGPVHLKHRSFWMKPIVDANCGWQESSLSQVLEIKKNKALVLPGSGRCYLSLGGARRLSRWGDHLNGAF